MKKLTTVLVGAMLVLAGCAVKPGSNITMVTFIFQTYDAQLRRVDYPITATFHVEGFAPWTPLVGAPTPAMFNINSTQYSAAARQIDVEVEVVAPPPTLVTCTWTAGTPSGTRNSEDSRGGEGSASVPHGGDRAVAYCAYRA